MKVKFFTIIFMFLIPLTSHAQADSLFVNAGAEQYLHMTLDPDGFAEEISKNMRYAKRGNAEAQYNLAVCYYYGYGVQQNYELAAYWLDEASKSYNMEFDIGFAYYNSGTEKNYKKAVYWLKKSARKGNPKGQFLLGSCYDFGTGMRQNLYKAFYWYMKSAQRGCSLSYYRLGKCYQLGRGVAKDSAKAQYWFQKNSINIDSPQAK